LGGGDDAAAVVGGVGESDKVNHGFVVLSVAAGVSVNSTLRRMRNA
jgi:hypothetical protein